MFIIASAYFVLLLFAVSVKRKRNENIKHNVFIDQKLVMCRLH